MTANPLPGHRCLVALALLLSACTLPTPPGGQTLLTGTATYRERMALPPGAQFEARIENVSRADAPAVPVAATRQPVTGVPVRFAIAFDPALLRPGERYGVRASIRSGDATLLFATDRAVASSASAPLVGKVVTFDELAQLLRPRKRRSRPTPEGQLALFGS